MLIENLWLTTNHKIIQTPLHSKELSHANVMHKKHSELTFQNMKQEMNKA